METITVYILFSEKLTKFYVGQTSDLIRRLEEPNRGKGKFTSAGVPWKLLYSIDCPNRSEATKLESQIKKRGIARYLKDYHIGM